MTFSPDGQMLVAGSEDRSARIWDVRSGRLVRKLGGHRGAILSVAAVPGTQELVSADGNDVINWDSNTGRMRVLGISTESRSQPNASIAVSPEGRILAVGGVGGVRLWDLKSSSLLKTKIRAESHVEVVRFSPDGDLIASAGWSRAVSVWNCKAGKLSHRLRGILHGHKKWVDSIAFSPDGTILASGGQDAKIKIWDLSSGKCRHTLEGHSGHVNALAFSRDGRLLASGSSDHRVLIWNMNEDSTSPILENRHSLPVTAVAFSPSGNFLASASGDTSAGPGAHHTHMTDGIKIWNMDSGTERNLLGHSGLVSTLQFAIDEDLLVSTSWDGTIRIWSIEGARSAQAD